VAYFPRRRPPTSSAKTDQRWYAFHFTNFDRACLAPGMTPRCLQVVPKPYCGGYAVSDDCNASYLSWGLRKTLQLFVPAFSKIITGLAKSLLGGLIPDLAFSTFSRDSRDRIILHERTLSIRYR
jgi:hypothetical protein